MSCWAFAATGLLQSYLKIVTGRIEDLSEEFLKGCIEGWPGCSVAGYPTSDAVEFALHNGIVAERDFNFTFTKPDPHSPQCQTAKLKNVLDGVQGAKVMKVTARDEERLKRVLFENGPVFVSILVTPGFSESWNKNVIYKDDPSCEEAKNETNHAVLLIGYGTDNETGLDYWLIKNSWGSKLGNKGVLKWLRNANNFCGITNKAFALTSDSRPCRHCKRDVPDPCVRGDPTASCGCTKQTGGVCWAMIANHQSRWCYTRSPVAKNSNEPVAPYQWCEDDRECSQSLVCPGCHRKEGRMICPYEADGYEVSPGDCKRGQHIGSDCVPGLSDCVGRCNENAKCRGFIYSDEVDHPAHACKIGGLCELKDFVCSPKELFENGKPGIFWYQKI